MKLTMQDLLRQQDHDPIWVINTTHGEQRGPVIFECPKVGGSDSISVPDTWLPINLIDQLPRQQILNSTTFRGALAGGKNAMLELIDDEQAQLMLSKPGADEEQDKLDRDRAKHSGITAEVFGEVEVNTREGGSVGSAGASSRGPQITPKVISVLDQIEERGEVAAINSLRTITRDLTQQDRNYIRDFAQRHNYDRLRQFESNLGK